jgi:NTP pyrophosphatase (non-canonical NTP hydrolase)
MMTFHAYEWEVEKAAFYPHAHDGTFPSVLYGAIGLNGEAGEVAEKVKKVWRDKDSVVSQEDALEIVKELGDCLFYITRMANELGYSIEDVAEINVNKFLTRKREGTLQGSGDNR